jgi:hypothetical protein
MQQSPAKLAREYPEQAASIIKLIAHPSDRTTLRELLGSCNCNSETLGGCECDPVYTQPKGLDYAGHV